MAGARPQADAGMTDARLLLGVWPYAGWFDPAPVYQNPNTCQIISAGRDGRFGPGTYIRTGGSGRLQRAGTSTPSSA